MSMENFTIAVEKQEDENAALEKLIEKIALMGERSPMARACAVATAFASPQTEGRGA